MQKSGNKEENSKKYLRSEIRVFIIVSCEREN